MTNVTAVASQLSDNELIMGYRNGNYSDFETLLARHQSKVYGYIFSVVKDKDVADDIFQDTFYTINSGMYKDENKFIHWVMRIAHNLIVDHYRRINKMPMVTNRADFDILETLRKLYARVRISEEETIKLSQCDALSVRLTRDAIKTAYAKEDFESELQFITCEEAIIVQAEHYMDSLGEYWKKKGKFKPQQTTFVKVLSRFRKAMGGK